jgi:exosome complex component RRP41
LPHNNHLIFDRRTLEFAAAIRDTFDPVVQTHLYPRSEIDIYVQILQQDGGKACISILILDIESVAGVLQACINATTLALITAGIPLTDYVAAMTCGVHSTSPILDLTNLEEQDLPHLTLATLPRSGKITLVSMETRLHVDRFEELLNLAKDAGSVIEKEMKLHVRARTEDLVNKMGGVGHLATQSEITKQGETDDET